MNQVQLTYELDLASESIWLTVTPSQAAKSSITYVQELGDFIAGEKYFTTRANLSSYLIKYTLSGEGVLEYGGENYTLKPGQGFWIDCGNPQHYYTSPKTGSWRVVWVHFYGATSAQYYELFLAQNNGRNVVNLPPSNSVSASLYALISLYKSGKNSVYTDVQASGLLTNICIELIGAAASDVAFSGVPDSVTNARVYLASHYKECISLDDLARRYSINKFYFLKLFKRHTGFTPNEFLILTRLNCAKEFLRTTNLSIGEIAAAVGIYSASHFINLFKMHEGVTPSSFRKSWYTQIPR